jgi:hypothetical protein
LKVRAEKSGGGVLRAHAQTIESRPARWTVVSRFRFPLSTPLPTALTAKRATESVFLCVRFEFITHEVKKRLFCLPFSPFSFTLIVLAQ